MEKLTKEWILALRSDDYQQGLGCLRKTYEGNDLFCCLGVACDLYDNSLWQKADGFEHSFLSNRVFMPEHVSRALGFEVDDDAPFHLAYLQDQKFKTFKELATIIENHFTGVETITEVYQRELSGRKSAA